MTKIYDTSSLLLITELPKDDKIIIPSIVIQELENIKTSAHKDEIVKLKARKILHLLSDYEFIIYKPQIMDTWLVNQDLEITNDNKILAITYHYMRTHPEESAQFVTNDLILKQLANIYLGRDNVTTITIQEDNYKGYIDLFLSEEEMANFYSYPLTYSQDLLINQYINIYDNNKIRVDTLCWTGTEFRPLKYKTFNSSWLGDIKPFKNDIYQAMAMDSLMNNKLTLIKGAAGSGKSLLSLGYLLYLLDKKDIDKIIIFCNPVATKNSARLGFYPGSRTEKLLDSQIGNFLLGKLGSRLAAEQLIEQEKLILLPFSDLRGFDTTGLKAGIYITEAQNLDIELVKLALQRVGEDCCIILDGDTKAQVDLSEYEGINNGMKKVSEIFRNQPFYGEITLQQIHRSKIAELANKL